MAFTIFVDLDDVLADFKGAALSIHNKSRSDVKSQDWRLELSLNLTAEEFWAPIDNNPGFWENLEPLPWMHDLLTLLESLADNVYILSAPSHCKSSYQGKLDWIHSQIGPDYSKLILTPHKHLLANSNTVLIDDSPYNVSKFREHGGKAIKFPHYWPIPTPSAEQVVEFVKVSMKLGYPH